MKERGVRNAIARALDENDADFDVETLFETVKAEETGDPTILQMINRKAEMYRKILLKRKLQEKPAMMCLQTALQHLSSRLGERPARDHVQPPPRARFVPRNVVYTMTRM